MMYTMNIVENLHMQLRKMIKTKTVGVTKKWVSCKILGQLHIHFEDRF
ncbi:MAG: hypothetical protein JXM74_05540 [Fusobacteriaceae bacterium]|nr:hypothetical protein [Fusobacteriaceae bacterium]